MYNDQKPTVHRETNTDISLFYIRMNKIWQRRNKSIVKNRCCLFKAYAMLFQILSSFVLVPFEDIVHSDCPGSEYAFMIRNIMPNVNAPKSPSLGLFIMNDYPTTQPSDNHFIIASLRARLRMATRCLR